MQKKRRKDNKSKLGKADRSYSKSTDKNDGMNVEHDARGTERNDVSWYTRNAQLALDAGRLAFTWPSGAPVDLGTNIDLYSATSSDRFPGVMKLGFYPTYGAVSEADDPLNVSAKNIYSWVRHANSGHANYDAPDLMLYLLAVDNIYMLYQHCVRVYGLMRLYAQKNRNLPSVVLQALDVDESNILTNLSDFRNLINTMAVKIGSLCVPNTMPLLTRHAWMCSGIYADSPSIKSQFYVYVPEALGYYDEYNGAGRLLYHKLGTLTLQSAKTLFDTLINPVIESEDMNIMSGDILKAYGEENLLKISMIGEDYMIAPQYSEEVLRQIQNATIVGTPKGMTGNNDNAPLLYQDVNKNIIVTDFKFRVSDIVYGVYEGKRIMTGTSESPDPGEVLVSSRLMVCGDAALDSDDSHYYLIPSSIGSEVITSTFIYTTAHTSGGSNTYVSLSYGESMTYSNQNFEINFLKVWGISMLSFFNYHPMIMLSWYDTGVNRVYPLFDVDNYAIVDAHDIEKLHNTSLLSMFDVPQIGRV